MSNKNWLNLTLLVIALLLFSVIYLSEAPDDELERLTYIDANSIENITIKNKKSTTIINRLAHDQWQISEPVSIAANNFRISSLLQLLNAPIHNRYSSEDIELDKIGLSGSANSISFNDKTISFGMFNPVTELRFILLDDNVYTIEDIYFPLLNSHFSTLVSLNLLPTDSHIEKLILTDQTISKDAAGQWQSNLKISADNINAIIENWQSIQAFGVHEYIERDSLGDVFIFLENQQQAINFIITDTSPWLIIARPELGLEYHLDIEAYDKLFSSN